MTFHSSRGRGRRLPASGSFDILWFLQRYVAMLPHAMPRPLHGGSPMGADCSMLHASPPGGSLPIREFVDALPLPLLIFCRPFASSLRPDPCRPPLQGLRCASSRRSDWLPCYAHLAYVSSASTCRAISGPPGQSFGGPTFSSHHRPRRCPGVSFPEMPIHESLAFPLHQSF